MSSKKIEVISFKDFMSRPARIQKKIPLQTNIYSFFPPITLKAFFPVADPAFALFLIGGGLIVAAAFSERIIASSGFSEVAGVIAGITKFVFPFVCYGLIFWFLFQL